jgi:hypothetical protein
VDRTWLGRESGGGEIHCPEHQPGGGEVTIAGGHDAEDFSTVHREVARGHGHTKLRHAGEAAGTGHVVKAGADVKVMTTAGASPNRCAAAMAPVGEYVTADTDNQVRVH